MPGRPPRPTSLKILTGSDQVHKERINEREPTPKVGRPPRPSWLRKEARRHWAHHVRVLEEMGVLTTADGAALAMLCNALADYIDAATWQQKADTWRRANIMLQQFGLTPSSRAKVKIEKKPVEDEFDALMRRKA